MRERLKQLMERLDNSSLAPLVQFIKFGLVGVSNTAISYGIEMLCYYVLLAGVSWPNQVRIAVTAILAFVISTLNSYYWNSRYIFDTEKKSGFFQHLKAYLRMSACYALTGLVLSPILKMWLCERRFPYWAASIAVLLLSVPLNFILNKMWAFRGTSDDKTN